jgi:hypothetical protein
MLPTKFRFIWPSGFREEDFLKSANQKQELLMAAMFVTGSKLNEIKPNLAGMVPGWVPFKIVSISAVLYPRWPPLLKIEISSNGQNCSILCQNVSFQQSLVAIVSLVSEEKISFLISSRSVNKHGRHRRLLFLIG